MLRMQLQLQLQQRPPNFSALRCAFSTTTPLASFIGRAPIRYDPASVRLSVPTPPPPTLATEPGKFEIDRRPRYSLVAEGPRGRMELPVPPCVRLRHLNPGVLKADIEYPFHRRQRCHWGSTRSLIASMIHGVSQGWEIPIKLVGIGYRACIDPPETVTIAKAKADAEAKAKAEAEAAAAAAAAAASGKAAPRPQRQPQVQIQHQLPQGKLLFTCTRYRNVFTDNEDDEYKKKIDELLSTRPVLNMRLGYSHTLRLLVPNGIDASCPSADTILLRGVNKRLLTQFAARIREFRKPEPYNQKGIFVNGETIEKKKPRKR